MEKIDKNDDELLRCKIFCCVKPCSKYWLMLQNFHKKVYFLVLFCITCIKNRKILWTLSEYI